MFAICTFALRPKSPHYVGMGASQSSPNISEDQQRRVGVFSLNSEQKRALSLLDEVVKQMLTKNNLFDMSKLLAASDHERCSELIVLLSSTLQKEFTMLRLPDPSKPSDRRAVSFMSKGDYAALETSPIRLALCNDIAWFALRLVTLLNALTASVHINREMHARLSMGTTAQPKTMNPVYKQIKFALSGREPMSSTILDEFVRGGQASFVRVPDSDTDDVRKLVYFNNQPSVVIDTRNRIVYGPRGEETGVASIEFEAVTTFGPAAVAAPLAPAPLAPAVAAVPAVLAPNTMRRNNTYRAPVVGGRRRRRATRRRQRGGNEKKYYRIILKECDMALSCMRVADTFYMDVTGNTFASDAFEAYMRGGSSGGILTGEPFSMRVGRVLARLVQQPLEAPVEKPTFDSTVFSPLNKLDTSSYKHLETIYTTLTTANEGSSPAQYRAYLLAASVDPVGTGVDTMYCNDKWLNNRATQVVAYGLLNSLYFDRMGGRMEPATANELARTIKQFIGTGAMVPYVSANKSITDVESFENVKFTPLPSQLGAFCGPKNGNSRPRKIYSTDVRGILLDAHKTLRALYDTHLARVRDLCTTKIITYKKRGEYRDEPIEWILNPVFATDPRGSNAVLEDIIREGRGLIANHYIAVETVYRNTIDKIKEMTQGSSAVTETTV